MIMNCYILLITLWCCSKRGNNSVIADDDQLFFERAPLWVAPVTLMGCCKVLFIGYVKELFLKMTQSLNLLPPVEKNQQVSEQRFNKIVNINI